VVEPGLSGVLGFPVGRGAGFPVDGVGVVVASVLSFRRGGFNRDEKDIFAYVLKPILTELVRRFSFKRIHSERSSRFLVRERAGSLSLFWGREACPPWFFVVGHLSL
jgi:hypothetical protein